MVEHQYIRTYVYSHNITGYIISNLILSDSGFIVYYLQIPAGCLNLGDQILVCDGVSLLDVTHDEAAEALKKAMDMESVCNRRLSSYVPILFVIAVSPVT